MKNSQEHKGIWNKVSNPKGLHSWEERKPLTTWELYTITWYCGCLLFLSAFVLHSYIEYPLFDSGGTDLTVTHTYSYRNWCRYDEWLKFANYGPPRNSLLEVSKDIALYPQKVQNILNWKNVDQAANGTLPNTCGEPIWERMRMREVGRLWESWEYHWNV